MTDDARCREQRKEGYREGRAAKTGGREPGEAMESLSVSRDAASARRGVRRDGESEEAGIHACRNSDLIITKVFLEWVKLFGLFYFFFFSQTLFLSCDLSSIQCGH